MSAPYFTDGQISGWLDSLSRRAKAADADVTRDMVDRAEEAVKEAHDSELRAYLAGDLAANVWRPRAYAEAVVAALSVSAVARMAAAFNEHPNSSGPDATRALLPTLHCEEHDELLEAIASADPAKIARELADVVYLAYTEAWAREIDIDAALIEIHRAAMDKMEANVRRADGKIIKPPGFIPPDMTRAVGS